MERKGAGCFLPCTTEPRLWEEYYLGSIGDYYIDKSLINGVLFLDLRKVFDTFDHEILIDELKLYGITWGTLNWFISYLGTICQKCEVNNVKSSRKLIECGVPQGSNLGPLLFLLYVNFLSIICQTLNVSKMEYYEYIIIGFTIAQQELLLEIIGRLVPKMS